MAPKAKAAVKAKAKAHGRMCASPVEAYARCKVRKHEASFVIEDFAFAFQSGEKIVVSAEIGMMRRIESKPVLQIGSHRVAIVVAWQVDPSGLVNLQGCMVIRMSPDPVTFHKPVPFAVALTIVNVDSSKNVTWGSLDRLAANLTEWRNLTPSIPHVKMEQIFDPTAGWLHSGALRVVAKSVVSGELEHGERQATGPLAPTLIQDLSESFRKLLASKHNADVVIAVGEGKIEAHSQILSARSPVFATMLSCGMREASTNRIVIADLDLRAMQELVSFIYTGCVQEDVLRDEGVIFDLLKAAHRYEISPLVEVCAASLSSSLSAESVTPAFEVADLLGCADLRQQCLEFVHVNASDVLEASSYNEFLTKGATTIKDMVKALALPPTKRARSKP